MFKEYRLFSGHSPTDWATLLERNSFLNTLVSQLLGFDNRLKLTLKYSERHSSVLDLGCGDGTFLALLGLFSRTCVGLDFSRPNLNAAASKYSSLTSNQLVEGKFENLPFQDSTFDTIISWGAFEHDERGLDIALFEALRVLKPKGTIIITTPYDDEHARYMSSYLYKPNSNNTFFQYYTNERDILSLCDRTNSRLIRWGFSGPKVFAKQFPGLYKRISNKYTLLRLALFLFNVFPIGRSSRLMAYYIIRKNK